MWRYLKTNSEPPGKKQKTDTEKLDADRKYEESKRDRSFQEHWLKGREWLAFDGKTMKCTLCMKYPRSDKDRKASFYVGTTSMKLENIKSHEATASHAWSVTCQTNKNKKAEQTSAGKAFASLTVAQLTKLSPLFLFISFYDYSTVTSRASRFLAGLVSFKIN